MSYAQYVADLRARPGVSVLYSCNGQCGRRQRLDVMFFCGNCSQFVCDACTSVEIDTFFCPTCLNSVLSAYAHQDGNRCTKCVECPCCAHTLSTACAATSQEYTFLCEFCHWDSKAVGLVATKAADLLRELKQKENVTEGKAAFAVLLEKCKQDYKQAALNRELADKYEVQISDQPQPVRNSVQDMQAHVDALEAAREEKVKATYRLPQDPADNSHVTPTPQTLLDGTQFDLDATTTLEQRLQLPGASPAGHRGLLPLRKHLLTKTAHRCRTCSTYVVKPKVGATHVAFDRRTFAITYIPTVTVSPITSLEPKKETQFVLYFKNPVAVAVHLSLEVIKEPDRNCDVFLPSGMQEVKMTEYDVTLEQEEVLAKDDAKSSAQDDPKVVAHRHLSKIGIRTAVMPQRATESVTFALKVGLRSEDKVQSEFDKFEFRVDICLGPTTEP